MLHSKHRADKCGWELSCLCGMWGKGSCDGSLLHFCCSTLKRMGASGVKSFLTFLFPMPDYGLSSSWASSWLTLQDPVGSPLQRLRTAVRLLLCWLLHWEGLEEPARTSWFTWVRVWVLQSGASLPTAAVLGLGFKGFLSFKHHLFFTSGRKRWIRGSTSLWDLCPLFVWGQEMQGLSRS